MKAHRSDSSADAIDTAASAWIVRQDAGLTLAEETELEHWRSADSRHAAALAAHEQAWSALDRPRQAGKGDFMRREYRARIARRRQMRMGGAAALLGVFFVTGLVWRGRQEPAAAALASSKTTTVVAPIRQILADGSRVDLKSGARIAVAFEPQIRRVSLQKGEAHFDVARNPERPFVVSVAGIEVRAVGTVFSVELSAQEISIVVTEGRVAIAESVPRGPTSAEPVQVDAGHRLVLSANSSSIAQASPTVISPREIDERLVWRQAHLEFSDTPLREAVALLNRYAAPHGKTRLAIDDPTVAAVPVSGYFRADSLDAFVRLIEASAGIEAERSGDTVTLRRAR